MTRSEGRLKGDRCVLGHGDEAFPRALLDVPDPPRRLHVVGDPQAPQEGLAIVGARKATPYGLSCAAHFAGIAAEAGIVVISGGARGCDAASHAAAVERGARTVVFLGGGCDEPYPAENRGLFQRVVDCGGAVASEQPWEAPPRPWMFRLRNRLIAGLSKATLIVEAGLPSGTFSTADEALAANREVLVVPGAITSKQSRGANRLICQGAAPVVDDETFHDQLFSIFGAMSPVGERTASKPADPAEERLLDALGAGQLTLDEMLALAEGHGTADARTQWLMMWLASMQKEGRVARYPGGRYGAVVAGS